VNVTRSASSNPALTGRSVALVAVGGMLGTGARHGLTLITPTWADVPLATMAVNVAGAFALGFLVGLWSHRPDDPRSNARGTRARLLWGTGLLGGFTTYSALAIDVVSLVEAARAVAALGYAAGTVVLGLMAAWAGLVAGHSRNASVGEEAP